MIDSAKKILKQFPGIKRIVHKNTELQIEIEEAKQHAVETGRELVDLRLKLKKLTGEKINVVFVCHRPAVWESLHSVYDALKSDDSFNVYIVAIPNKKELPKLWLNHEIYESEGAEEFWKGYGCINGYDYEKKEWFDLQKLEPDYVFFQQPYNITRCEEYKSWNVARYSKLCYLNYFSPVKFDELYDECIPADFMRCLSFYFTQNPIDHDFINERFDRMNITGVERIMTGYPRYDGLKNVTGESDIWLSKTHEYFRLIWTPRWTTNEGNCHFFDYKDKLIDFCLNNDIELVLRPHPQAFQEWESTGEFNHEAQTKLRELFESEERLHLDESSYYLDTMYSSDCLLTDLSSIIYDYFLTGNPIIYALGKNKKDKADLLHDGMYEVDSWDAVENVLKDLLSGKDKLASVRKEIEKQAYYINENGSGNEIRDILKM